MKELLKKLSEAHGVSGYENNISDIIQKELNRIDFSRIDVMGNIIVTKHGTKPSIMIATHMDEIGLLVKHIDDDGFIYFSTIGGWFDQTLMNQRVILHTEHEEIYGVVGSKPPHTMEADEYDKPVKMKDMFIDVGAKDKTDVDFLNIEIGTPVTIDRDFKELDNDCVTCKAFDNRVGVALMIELMRNVCYITKHMVYGVGTVQEEVGLKGARTSAYNLHPDFAIIIDTDICGGHPGIDKKDTTIVLGDGPVLTISDGEGGGFMCNPAIIKSIRKLADGKNIKYQLSVSEGGTTDGAIVHLTQSGIPTVVIGIPTRYIHSPVEVLSMGDVDEARRLCLLIIENVEQILGN